MGKASTDFGYGVASQAAGGIMGMIMGRYNDRRQYDQQSDLQELQIQGQKEMTDYNMMKQLEMWKNTSYPAQLEMMKKAGINPALMYGMGGGGGQSTGTANGNVTGGTATQNPGEMGMGMQSAMQMQLLKAQKENIEADTELKKTDATKKSGVDTAEAQTRILDLTQGIENKQAQEALTKVQTEIAGIESRVKTETAQDSISLIRWAEQQAGNQVEQLYRQNVISKATMNDKIDTIKGEMFGVFIRNAMMKAGTTNIDKDTQKKQAEIEAIIRQGVQQWRMIETNQQNAQTNSARQQQDAWINDVQKSTQIPMEILKEAVDGILRKGTTVNKQYNTETNNY